MNNLPAQLVQMPTPTPCVTRSMSQGERAHHRSQIGFKVEVIMQGYWINDLVPEMKAAVLADWADELEDWRLDQITWALREWRRENPSRKPNPGHISAMLRKRRGTEVAARIAEAKSQEAPRAILDEETRLRRKAEIDAILGGLSKRPSETPA